MTHKRDSREGICLVPTTDLKVPIIKGSSVGPSFQAHLTLDKKVLAGPSYSHTGPMETTCQTRAIQPAKLFPKGPSPSGPPPVGWVHTTAQYCRFLFNTRIRSFALIIFPVLYGVFIDYSTMIEF